MHPQQAITHEGTGSKPDAGDLNRRSRFARVSLWVVVVSDAVAIISAFPYADYLRSLPSEEPVEELELVASGLVYALAGLAQVGAYVFAGVFFLRWFHLAHRNLGQISAQPAVYSSKWCYWGFFIPFLSLIRPQQVMREVWDGTSKLWNEHPDRVHGLDPPKDIVNLWWGFCLAIGFVGARVFSASFRATTAAETLNATWFYQFSDWLDIVAALVAVQLVRRITILQQPFLGSLRHPCFDQVNQLVSASEADPDR